MSIAFQTARRFLCSELARPRPKALPLLRLRQIHSPYRRQLFSTLKRQCNPEVASTLNLPDAADVEQPTQIRSLPTSCPGCGALSQLQDGNEAGHYSMNRKAVRQYLYGDEIFHPQNAYPVLPDHEQGGKDAPHMMTTSDQGSVPYCDRCHNLVHHNQGAPIAHPSLRSINEIIDSSPHKKNHVYHVLDAADFPMSIIPNLHERLSLGHVRSKNRRSKRHHFSHGRETDMSFIITRSDLLAPRKDQVDALVPKLKEILRHAMGSFGSKARLHVKCVSAHRGWWTRPVKEEIWERGGGQWLVGRVNVGKSGLLETIFPKGRNDSPDLRTLMREAGRIETDNPAKDTEFSKDNPDIFPSEELRGKFSLLPPPQPLVQYPTMPVISSLPGTTASPIRIPFGNRKGELIDLPGVERNDLTQYVLPSERHKLVMQSRIKPERISIKPGSSLLLGGGLIRITPTNPDQIILAAVFTTLSTHLTNTSKAIALQTGEITSPAVAPIITPEASANISRAGLFRLDTNVTRAYAGPLTRRDAVGLKPDQLPFAIFGTDILIAGCGWVELVAQVRRRKQEPDEAISRLIEQAGTTWPNPVLPEVEVWTPGGKGVGNRACIEAWTLGKPLRKR
jgi:genetic interactor of prohibitins 3, mitochondrial